LAAEIFHGREYCKVETFEVQDRQLHVQRLSGLGDAS